MMPWGVSVDMGARGALGKFDVLTSTDPQQAHSQGTRVIQVMGGEPGLGGGGGGLGVGVGVEVGVSRRYNTG